MSLTYRDEILNVDKYYETWFKSQIANSLAFQRHNIKCATLSLNYNYPLHLDEKEFRNINSDDGKNNPEDIKVFHYLGDGVFNKEDFLTNQDLEMAMKRSNLSPSASMFKKKLMKVHQIINQC